MRAARQNFLAWQISRNQTSALPPGELLLYCSSETSAGAAARFILR